MKPLHRLHEEVDIHANKSSALRHLKNDYRDYGRITTDYDGNVIVYHGTSETAAKEILNTGVFHDGFFFGSRKGVYGDTPEVYARMRASQKGEKGNGRVLTMVVDPRFIRVNGAGELESIGDLHLVNDVWTSPKLSWSSDDRIEELNLVSSQEFNEMFSLPPTSRLAYPFLNMIRRFFISHQLKSYPLLNKAFHEELEEALQLSPQKLSRDAKNWGLTPKQYKETLVRLSQMNVQELCKKSV